MPEVTETKIISADLTKYSEIAREGGHGMHLVDCLKQLNTPAARYFFYWLPKKLSTTCGAKYYICGKWPNKNVNRTVLIGNHLTKSSFRDFLIVFDHALNHGGDENGLVPGTAGN